jgi:leader peptidase (prepilin peptidase) / N-methyltransferase
MSIAASFSTLRLDASGWTLLAAAPIVGSFLGVLIRRLPERVPVVWSRSRCEFCETGLAVRDLVPLASWLLARGQCRYCGRSLGWFYPAVELAALALVGASLAIDRGIQAWLDALLGWCLLTLGWIDARTGLLPDVLTLPLIAVGLAAAWLFAPAELIDRTVGAIAGYLCLWLLAYGYRRLRGREGLGLGDAKLLAAGGAWVGASGLASVVAGGAVAALIAAGGLMLLGVRLGRTSALPFGPFLAAAIWLVWLFGPIP